MIAVPKMPGFRLDNRRALVTGGSRGIGFAAAVALAQAGAEVWIAARDAARLEEAAYAAASAGFPLHTVALDITDTVQVNEILATLPAFDVLVNSAGLARHQPFLQASEASFDAVMALNLRATFFLSQQVARRMHHQKIAGSIIHVSSQMGHVGGPERSVYCASKFALEGLSKAMALELGEFGIRVNTLCPTFIDTELSRANLADPQFSEYVLGNIALKRLGKLEDVMGPVVFLASPASALVTGASLLVDGGWTAS